MIFEMVPVAPIITGITFVFYIIIIIINLEYLYFPFTTQLIYGEVRANIEMINF
jgi:hypothetical protein